MQEHSLLVGDYSSIDNLSSYFNDPLFLFGEVIVMNNDTIRKDSILLDIDNDKKDDFTIGFYESKSLLKKTSWIKRNHKNLELLVNADYKYVQLKKITSIIANESISWSNKDFQWAIASTWSESGMDTIDNKFIYIPFRKIENNKRKYGWIQVNPKKCNGIEIYGYGIQK